MRAFCEPRCLSLSSKSFCGKGNPRALFWHAASEKEPSSLNLNPSPNSQPAVNSNPASLDRHKRITLLFLKHAALRTTPPDEPAARSLARDLENLGAPFVKTARLLSVRGDLLPPSLLDAFGALTETRFRNEDQEAESIEVIDQVLEDEIGKKALRAFSSFHPVPSRFSGAGQVHHAVLHDGRHVSVRVQRPKVRQRIVKDLDTLAEIAAFIDHPSGRGEQHRFSRFVDRVRVTLMRELDYRREEAALIDLREKMNGYSRLRVPLPVQEFCSGRVLTTEFIDGSEIWEVPSRRDGGDGRELAEQFLGSYLDQILVHGLVHPQPSLENHLITADGELVINEACGTLRIGTVPRSLLGFLLHGICSRDPAATADAALRLGHQSTAAPPPDQTAFVADIHRVLSGGSIQDRLRSVARVASTAGHPFPLDICRIADLFANLATNTEAISPRFDAEQFIAGYLRDQIKDVRENTILFPSPSAA